MKLFELFATLSLDTGSFNRDIKSATKQGQSFAGAMQKKLGAGTIAMGNLISKVVEKTASGLYQLGKKAFKTTGELEQNLGGSEAVWGEWADNIQATASHAFSNMGLSMSDYLAEANKMGSLLKGSGYTTAEAYQMTTDVMQRAADVASIMGIDISSAMQAVEGAAKGNFTMMDNLGVAINDTTLANYALEKGITKSVRSMTTQEKTALAFQLFMERTADYAGNYAAENDTLAGSFTTLSASFDNFLVGKGTVDEFVEAVENAARVSFRTLGEMVPRLASSIGIALQKAWPKAKALLGEWAHIGYEKGSELIANIYNGITGGRITPEDVKGIFTSITDSLSDAFGNAKSFISDVLGWIPEHQTEVTLAIGAIGAAFIAFKVATDPAGAAIGLIIAGFTLIVANWESVKEVAGNVATAISEFFTKTIPDAWDSLVASVAEWGAEHIFDPLSNAINSLKQKWDDITTSIKNAIQAVKEFFGLSDHDNPVSSGQTFGGQEAKTAVDEWTDALASGDLERQQTAWSTAQAALGGQEAASSFVNAYTQYLAQNNLDFGARVPAEWFEGTEEDLQSGLDGMSLTAEPEAKWDSGARSTLQSALSGMGLTAPVTLKTYMSGSSLIDKAREKIISGAPGHATGLDYVPYNDYLSRLHEGEAVLTKAEASLWRSGGQVQSPTIDYERLAGAIASAMAGTSVQMDGQAVGVLVAPTVSREFGRQTLSRKHTTR